ncbi:tetratricopeptide repeat-containing serine protease family protein [Trichloromonas acetexigens]|uniref:Trypsin-like serine protease n=1 Tax=Trichloromonas acetexigens TaxID=38815 RepID=A0A550J8Z5_9BACT|nr:tetratricopeptide repeat-containing serine protease family protein [Desulfuromonas acetexigens]TRO79710.1 trypsin-like serine protease [Desulfuromonas acetexigens]
MATFCINFISLFFFFSLLSTASIAETDQTTSFHGYDENDKREYNRSITEQSFNSNLGLIIELAKSGDITAQKDLGKKYLYGENFLQDYNKAIYWYRKAADTGDLDAQFNLGICYYQRLDQPEDLTEMFYWLEKAASKDHLEAQQMLDVAYAQILEIGSKAFNEGNYEIAFKFLKIAAEKGYSDAQLKIGQMYARGNYVDQDDKMAVKWFTMASNQNHGLSTALLGNMYMNGRGVEKDLNIGLTLIYYAAALGNEQAKSIIEMTRPDHFLAISSIDENRSKAVLSFIDKNITEKSEKKYFWQETIFLSRSEENINAIDSKLLTSYRVEDCRRNEYGFKQLEDIVIPDHKIEMVPAKPGSLIHKYVCENLIQNYNDSENEILSSGTGWLMPSGYIATNHHVVDGHTLISLIDADGKLHRASIVKMDKINDLALLKIDEHPPNLLPLPLSNSHCLAGQEVFTIGYPHPDLLGREAKVTNGIVSSSKGFNDDPRMLQISVPVQAGNSGGPLINPAGEVVGIVTEKLEPMGVFNKTGDFPQNVNYAIKINYLDALSEGLKKLPTRKSKPINKVTISDFVKTYKNSVFLVIAN